MKGKTVVLAAIIFVVPVAARAELELTASIWTTLINNVVYADVTMDYRRDIVESDLLSFGFGFGLVYWFPGMQLMGAGLEVFQAARDTMKFLEVCPYLLFRFQLGQGEELPHGRIMPYFGIGFALVQLEEDSPLFGGAVDKGLTLISPDGIPSVLVFKAGAEWFVLGWLAFSLEVRFMTSTLEMNNPEDSDYEPYGTVHAKAALAAGQVAIGVSLHL
ncbi:MAG: hypothetical protein ACLQDL_11880 [Spirochaetia bacterium]